jgi:hypothetical protein
VDTHPLEGEYELPGVRHLPHAIQMSSFPLTPSSHASLPDTPRSAERVMLPLGVNGGLGRSRRTGTTTLLP